MGYTWVPHGFHAGSTLGPSVAKTLTVRHRLSYFKALIASSYYVWSSCTVGINELWLVEADFEENARKFYHFPSRQHNFWALCGPFFIVPAAFKLWASLCMVLHAPLPWNYEKYDHLNLYFTCKARRIGHFSSHYYLLCRILIVLPSPPTVMLRTHPPIFILLMCISFLS